ncbi:MAG: response regulator transcription factor [Actinomycetales bacterium]|nr:response regulator transcription factor [Actinomycetales bacterium]
MTDGIGVLIVDDEAIVRRGIRLILGHAEGIEVLGEGQTGAEAIRLTRELRPDVVLMDIRMPQTDGLSATPAVVRDGARVLVLTTYDNDENLYRAFQAGASGFVLKTAHPDDLVHAVRVVARGDSLIQPEITRRLIERFAAPPPAPPAWAGRLSERERDVLDLMASGLSNAEIATRLVLAEPTVKTHVAAVLSKMGVRDRLQAVVTAYASGYVEGDR